MACRRLHLGEELLLALARVLEEDLHLARRALGSRRELAAAAKCTARQVQVFFQNARQREKKLLAQVEASACHVAQY